jgi:serine protease
MCKRQPVRMIAAALALGVAWSLGVAHVQSMTPYDLRPVTDARVAVEAWNQKLRFVPGEVLVKFRTGTTPSTQSRALSAVRGRVDATASRWIGDVFLAHVPDEPDPEVAAAVVSRQPEVEWAQPNYLRELHATPNDPSYPLQWNFQLMEMPRAWDINPGGSSDVTVAVLDTGVTTVTSTLPMTLWTGNDFEVVDVPVAIDPDIAATRILPGRDFVFWSGPVIDFVGHGTHIASTILQETNNGVGLSGIAYRAQLMPLKVCYGYWEVQFLRSAARIPGYVDPSETGSCPDSAVSEAIRYAADNGARFINLSLGGPQPSPVTREALQYATSRGVFVAISNGNQFEHGNGVEYPAAYAPEMDGVVSVGAVGRTSRRAYYSSTGPHLEVVAPGGDVREGGIAGQIFQVSLVRTLFDPATVVRPRFDRYGEVAMEGSSMATPHVVGVGALLYSQGISNPAAVEAALRKFARDLGASGRDVEYGDGLVDARASLRGLGLVR